jgi:hypothetical protein
MKILPLDINNKILVPVQIAIYNIVGKVKTFYHVVVKITRRKKDEKEY